MSTTDLWKCPVFTDGQEVICKWASGYHFLQEGERYTIAKYEPRCVDPTFTWPAYVHIETPRGRIVCHASRFMAVPEAAA